MAGFTLDPRLAADTLEIATLKCGLLRLMNDRRWPWLILVPQIAGATELHLLDAGVSAEIHARSDRCAAALAKITSCDKINTAALGNVVRQLHIHIVARFAGDANWPGPVWGFDERQAWPREAAERLVEAVRNELVRMGDIDE